MSGWNLPPGVSLRDIDPPEQPCEMCGHFEAQCICIECPTCGSIGDPLCHEKHNLVATPAQIHERQRLERELTDAARIEAEYYSAHQGESHGSN